jgi:hypothetical protein
MIRGAVSQPDVDAATYRQVAEDNADQYVYLVDADQRPITRLELIGPETDPLPQFLYTEDEADDLLELVNLRKLWGVRPVGCRPTGLYTAVYSNRSYWTVRETHTRGTSWSR